MNLDGKYSDMNIQLVYPINFHFSTYNYAASF